VRTAAAGFAVPSELCLHVFGAAFQRAALVRKIEPLRIEIDREEDGRVLASVPDHPGVMAYGDTKDAAVLKVKSIALLVLADMVESGDDVPEPPKALFAA
jgi:predicted RNase H-like HicB family nuclease